MALKDLPIEQRRFYHSLIFPSLFVLILWLFKIYELIEDRNLSNFGIYPRQFDGLQGILLSPLVHYDFNHLLSNTISLYFLMIGIFYFFNLFAYKIFFVSYFVPNIIVWIIGRSAYHIGCSGIIYSFAFFLFFSGIVSKNNNFLALSLLVTFLYGSMIWGLFPLINQISWESHISGALTGIILAYYFKPKIVEIYKIEDVEMTEEDENLENGYDDYNQKVNE